MFLPLPSFKFGSTSQAVNRKSIGTNRERCEQQLTRKRCLTELYRMHKAERISSISLICALSLWIVATTQRAVSTLWLEELRHILSMSLIMWLSGMEPMKPFETSWPESFYEPLSNKAVTMSISYNYIQVGSADCSNTNLVYLRVMDVHLKYVFYHQLAPVPTSVLKDNGVMRITKSKSRIKWKLQVEQSSRTMPTHETNVVDCCAIK